MSLKKLWIKISNNENWYLVTTEIDDWIYAEWETIEEALINFLDVYRIVREAKWWFSSLKSTNELLFDLPVSR